MENKRGMNQVISTVLLVLLTVGAVAGAGVAINSFVRSTLNDAGACNGILEKVSLNSGYTCYDPSSGMIMISIARGELAMDSLTVAVSGDLSSKTFSLTDQVQNIPGLINYIILTSSVSLPGNESGKTYCYSGFSDTPTKIEISPKRNGVQCSIVDSIDDLPKCLSSVISGCGDGGGVPVCGNTVCEAGEDSGSCPSDCALAPVCGNNAVESGEQCDDGNTIDGDGCSSTCQNEISGLLIELNFDGDVQDSSGNNHHGTLTGATYTTGVSGQAISFDGLGDYVSVPYVGNLPQGSVAFWLKSSGSTGNTQLFFEGDGTSQYSSPGFEGDSTNFYFFLNEDVYVIPTTYTQGMWTHFAGTWDGSTCKLYKNGALVSSLSCLAGENGITNFYIGGRGSSYTTYGLMDELKVYNRALSLSEVQSLYGVLQPVCGNGVCEPPSETATSCASDCGTLPGNYLCGDGQCLGVESQANCATDCGPITATNCNYYASPAGGGNGLSQSSPFQIADFWGVENIAGKKLCLMDGTYTGLDSMIQPPEELSGTQGNPITISALHDGEVFIDGQGAHVPVSLDYYNSWFVLEGFNACCSGAVVDIFSSSDNIIVRRVVGWDAAEGNTNIFGVAFSKNVLFEDCAGFGVARKIFGRYGGSAADENHSLTLDTNDTFRRVFARLQYSTWGGPTAITTDYNTNYDITENAIATVDGYLADQSGLGAGYADVIDSDRPWDRNNQLLGSIFYRIEEESITGSPLGNMVNIDGENNKVRDVLSYVGGSESTWGVMWQNVGFNYQRNPSITGVTENSNSDVKFITLVGGPGSSFRFIDGSTVSHIIATDANWQGSDDPEHDTYGYAIQMPLSWSGAPDEGLAPDYVMAYNNIKNWNNVPAHYSTLSPDLIGRFGNLLQYGTSQRPTVNGQSVGAQIQCRYENGVLTNKPLWPWPMNERIRIATCMYDYGLSKDECESLSSTGVDVTKTIFELGGGSVPDFASVNPQVCPGSI